MSKIGKFFSVIFFVLCVMFYVNLSSVNKGYAQTNELGIFPAQVENGEAFAVLGIDPKNFPFKLVHTGKLPFYLLPSENCGYLSSLSTVRLAPFKSCFLMPKQLLGGIYKFQIEYDSKIKGPTFDLETINYDERNIFFGKPKNYINGIPVFGSDIDKIIEIQDKVRSILISVKTDVNKNIGILSIARTESILSTEIERFLDFLGANAGKNLYSKGKNNSSYLELSKNSVEFCNRKVQVIEDTLFVGAFLEAIKKSVSNYKASADYPDLKGLVVNQTANSGTIEYSIGSMVIFTLSYSADPAPNWSIPSISMTNNSQLFSTENNIDNAQKISDLRVSVGSKSNGISREKMEIAVLDTGGSPSVFEISKNFIDPNKSAADDFAKTVKYIENSSEKTIEMVNHGKVVGEVIRNFLPLVKIISAKVCDKDGICPVKNVIQGVCWAISEMKKPGIINLSLGGEERSGALEILMGQASKQGFVFVASAGNKEEYYKQRNFQGEPIHHPSSSNYAVSVGAVGNYENSATSFLWNPVDFSQRHQSVDIAAPGVGLVIDNREYHGTSFAAPFVTAAIARFGKEAVLKQGCKKLEGADPRAVGCGVLDLSSFK